MSFASDWGHGGIIVGNLFALRSPYPNDLRAAVDPIGPDNNAWLQHLASQCSNVVGAWGNHGTFMQRGSAVATLFPLMKCLGITKRGQPKHPLYVASGTSLVVYKEAGNLPLFSSTSSTGKVALTP